MESIGGQVIAVTKVEEIGKAHQAMCDVADWLGFEGSGDYLRALRRERHRIFKRAKEEENVD